MSDSNQVGLTDITAEQFPGYVNVTRDGDEVRLTVRNSGTYTTAVRKFTRSEAISFFADVLKVLA